MCAHSSYAAASVPKRVLIADDHPLVLLSMQQLIEALPLPTPLQVSTAPSAQILWTQCRQQLFDLVLLDLCMPDMQAMGGLQAYIETFSRTHPTALFTAYASPEISATFRESGGRGVLHKTEPVDVLRGALLLLLNGASYFPEPGVLRQPSTWMPDCLTPRQREVLTLLTEGHSNKAIARTLGLSLGTVKNHVHHIYRVIGADNRQHALRLSIRPFP